MLQPKQPHSLVSGVVGYVQWGGVTENGCHRACVWVCAMQHFPWISKCSWTHLLKNLPLSSGLRPCCCQEKEHTSSLEASRGRRIRDTTTLNLLRIHSSGASCPHWAQWPREGHSGAPSLLEPTAGTVSFSLWAGSGPGFSPPEVNTVHQSSVHQRVKPELRWISWNFTKPFAFFSTERHAIKMPNMIPLELHFVFNLISFMCITIGNFSLGKVLHHAKPYLREKTLAIEQNLFPLQELIFLMFYQCFIIILVLDIFQKH